MITSLPQIVNCQVDCQDFLSTSLLQVVQQVCKDQVASSLIFTDLNLSTGLMQLHDKPNQASKMHSRHNFYQVHNISGRVAELFIW